MSELQSQLKEILGPAYRLDRELAGAGMSRVFVATEVELDRQVVVKVLPPDLSAGINTDRFRREIQLAARLQHPHIVPLMAAGARGSLLYYTMPFIAGENLRARLSRSGELPVQEATRILREIADALGYAHSQGVVHRDIKPENILISGTHALVTDFGVSKALTSATAETPAVDSTLTSLGMALGTPAYMAPEQAAADPMVDHRADIYALGVVGYELLAGRTPFPGLNPQQTLAAHVTTAPAPVAQHRPQLPPGLATVIMRCLEKRASDRWQSAADLHGALEPYAITSGASAPFQPAEARRGFVWTPQRIAIIAGAVGLAATALIMTTVAFRGGSETLVVANTSQVSSNPGLEIHPSISPDGRMVAYVTRASGRQRLFVRQVSGGRAIALTDTSVNAQWPRWSSDGSTILYRSGGDAWSVPALGGSPVPVSGLDSLFQCTWSNAGDRFACVNDFDGRLAVVDRGGKRRYLTAADAENIAAPAWSADDRSIAFTTGNPGFVVGQEIGNIAPSSIWVVSANGGQPVRVTDQSNLNAAAVWTPDGSLLFVSSRGGTRDIYKQRLSADLTPRGLPVRVTTGLNPHTISLSRDGRTLAYSAFTTVSNIWTTTAGRSPGENVGAARPVTTGNQTIESGRVSPDGKWLAYDSNLDGDQEIYKVLIAGGEPQQLTSNDFDDFNPHWSPDGNEIAFHGLKSGTRDVFVMDASGANLRAIAEGPDEQRSPRWEGNDAITYDVMPNRRFKIRRTDARWQKPEAVSENERGLYSPDGKWVVRNLREPVCAGCARGLHVMKPDGSSPRHISNPGGRGEALPAGGLARFQVVWSGDSRHIYLPVRERDGSVSLFQHSISGDGAKKILHFTDATRQPYRVQFDIHGENFYFTIGDRQSDIWVMELKDR